MSMTEIDLSQHVKNALAYPNVGPDAFKASFVFSRINGNDQFPELQTQNVSVIADGTARLAGAQRDVPTYQVTLTDDDGKTRTLKNRIALIGYGSNSSKSILSQKFNSFAAAQERDLEICVLSAQLKNHAVVHGAFLGVRGPVPATIHHDASTTSTITLSLYDVEAAQHMTTTEPNYNLMALEQSAQLPTGIQVQQPLAYVSVWGALSDKVVDGDGTKPVALSVIPSETDLKKASSIEILRSTMHATDGLAADAQTLDRYIRENIQNEDQRFERIATMQELYKLHPNVRGDLILPSSIASKPQAAALIARFS